jgi:hypothetical protein
VTKNRRFLLAGLALALLIAGVVSYYASRSPDGLTHVAQSTGFLDSAQGHATAGGPVAGYETKGVNDARLSKGLAGLVGALVVLAVMAGLVFVVRRKNTPER